MSILLITTGGTIGAQAYADPTHPPIDCTMLENGRDLVAEAAVASPYPVARCISLPPKDSKLIDEAYRQEILALITGGPERSVLITHGTDRILQGADYFYGKWSALPEISGKSLILTGAMTPLANGKESDGYQNLDFALAWLSDKAAPAGVFIVLSDFDGPDETTATWKPHLYPYKPGVYEKLYVEDGRYNRIRRIKL